MSLTLALGWVLAVFRGRVARTTGDIMWGVVDIVSRYEGKVVLRDRLGGRLDQR